MPQPRSVRWYRRLMPLSAFAPVSILLALGFLVTVSDFAPNDGLLRAGQVCALLATVGGLAGAARATQAARRHEGWRPLAVEWW